MSYRPVDEVFWTDPKVRALSPIEKYLFLYFITNPHASFTGVYYLPLPTVIFETGLTEIEYRMGMDTLSVGYMVLEDRENSIFWVVNMAKFQVTSDKQRTGARKHFKTIQRSWILAKFAEKYPDIISESEYPTDTLPIPYQYPTDTKERDRERETERETERIVPSDKPKKRSGPLLVDEEWISQLKANPAYSGIDIDRELGKMRAWLTTPRGAGKTMTRQRVISWINRAEPTASQTRTPLEEELFPYDPQLEALHIKMEDDLERERREKESQA